MGVAGRALAPATKKPPFRKRGVGGIYTYTSNYTARNANNRLRQGLPGFWIPAGAGMTAGARKRVV